MQRTPAEWFQEYTYRKAVWMHDRNPRRQHALLTSGMHADGVFDSRPIIADKVLLRDAASDLLEKLVCDGVSFEMIDGFIGPQTGGTRLAEYLSDQVMAFRRGDCFYASPRKHEIEVSRSMVFTSEESELLPSSFILICDDVFAVGSTVKLLVEELDRCQSVCLPYVLVLVNGSGFTHHDNRKIISLIDYPMAVWSPNNGSCPLSRNGSKAIRPKEGNNWELLNADY